METQSGIKCLWLHFEEFVKCYEDIIYTVRLGIRPIVFGRTVGLYSPEIT